MNVGSKASSSGGMVGIDQTPSVRQTPRIRGELESGPRPRNVEKMETAIVLEPLVEKHSRSVLLNSGFGK